MSPGSPGFSTPTGTRSSTPAVWRRPAAAPIPLVEALRRLKRDSPEIAGRLEVVLAGPLSADEQQLLAAPDLTDLVKVVGWLERPRALALQSAADTLLVVTEGASRRSVATGKVFEYLAARRPILVLGEGTEAARIVVDAGAGTVTSASDPGAIASSPAGSSRGLADADGSRRRAGALFLPAARRAPGGSDRGNRLISA